MATRVLYRANGCSGDWIDVAREMQRTHGWEPCYWITALAMDEMVADAFPGAIRHPYLRAMRGLPPEGFASIRGRTLDEPTLERFRQCESRTLSMMNRMDVAGSFTYQERIRHYHRLLSYWLGVVDAIRPELAVFSNTPHEVADYVACEACHLSGIPTLIYLETRLPLTVAIRTSVDADIHGLRDQYSCRAQDTAQPDHHGSVDPAQALGLAASVPDSTKHYLRGLLGSYDDALPDYMRRDMAAGPRRGLLRRAANAMKVWRWGLYARNLTRGFFQHRRICGRDAYKIPGVPVEQSWMTTNEVLQVLRKGIRKKEALRIAYSQRVAEVDLTCAYVYLPLHYQPESTTNPDGGDYTHQLLAVGLLHDLLPEGWLLYVREHPTQFLAEGHGEQGRDVVFYHDLQQYPRVRLVGLDVSPFELIDSARAVATVTGTAGWEGVVRGVPALVFGNAWYRLCEGVFRINSADDLRAAYQELVEGFEINPRRVGCFVEALQSAASRADTDQSDLGRSQEITKEENVAGLVRLLNSAVASLDGLGRSRQSC